jgi:16S rRNA (cytosine967-C5)-methyltransferase
MTSEAGPTGNIRAEAARTLARLLSQQGSLASLGDSRSPEDSALLRELCFGTCRWFFRLEAVLQQLLSKPLKAKDLDIHCLLLIGIYQLQFLRIPDHAVVNETVSATAALDKHWARALVNGVLRQFLRQKDALLAQADCADPGRYAHPRWLIQGLRKAWPSCWQSILEANNEHSPMTLRVNRRLGTRADYLATLAAAGIAASAGELAESSVYLETPMPVTRLPGFAEGLISVQDEASQLIPDLMMLAPGLSLLDACAAPGGKTCHLLAQATPPQQLLALDIEERRLVRMQENLQRLGLSDSGRPEDPRVEVRQGDATQPSQWQNSQCFDRILLDAPCSATGIIRRQPDIKLLRREADIVRLQALQRQLLQAMWDCLKPGGLLLYSTCSVLPAENDVQIAWFLSTKEDLTEEPITAQWGVECPHGRQLLPRRQGPDGFYFARLRKRL